MSLRPVLIALVVLLCTTASSVHAAQSAPWKPRVGDSVIVDTGKSIVFLVHENGESYGMDALTGQRRVVSYDGITYFAETPEREWELREFEEKAASVTFGNGRFGRLSWVGHEDPRRGDESTAYGFHSHRTFERMLRDKRERTAWDRKGTGHRSMGCILVSEDDLTLIRETWELNNKVLRVSTRRNVDELLANTEIAVETEAPSWLGWLAR